MKLVSARRVVTVVLPLALLLLGGGCATNPVTGRKRAVAGEQRPGAAARPRGLRRGDRGVRQATRTPRLTAYVDSVGQRVARASHLPSLEWHFTVLDDPIVNAFAMPGGYIYITRGILAHLNSEAQLAGVLGHEIGHVTHRHTAEQMTQQQLVGPGLHARSRSPCPNCSSTATSAQQALGLHLPQVQPRRRDRGRRAGRRLRDRGRLRPARDPADLRDAEARQRARPARASAGVPVDASRSRRSRSAHRAARDAGRGRQDRPQDRAARLPRAPRRHGVRPRSARGLLRRHRATISRRWISRWTSRPAGSTRIRAPR